MKTVEELKCDHATSFLMQENNIQMARLQQVPLAIKGGWNRKLTR